MKKTLCLDFDGVIHSYTSPWTNAQTVSDPPVPGAIAFLREAVNHYEVAIFSSRSHEPGGIEAMAKWLLNHVLEDVEDPGWISQLHWPITKPLAFLTIDDRAIRFTGEWPTLEEMASFKPWNRS